MWSKDRIAHSKTLTHWRRAIIIWASSWYSGKEWLPSDVQLLFSEVANSGNATLLLVSSNLLITRQLCCLWLWNFRKTIYILYWFQRCIICQCLLRGFRVYPGQRKGLAIYIVDIVDNWIQIGACEFDNNSLAPASNTWLDWVQAL